MRYDIIRNKLLVKERKQDRLLSTTGYKSEQSQLKKRHLREKSGHSKSRIIHQNIKKRTANASQN